MCLVLPCTAPAQAVPMEQSLCSQWISFPKYFRVGHASCATLAAFAGRAGVYPKISDEGMLPWILVCPQEPAALGEGSGRGGGRFPGSEAFTWETWRIPIAGSMEWV